MLGGGLVTGAFSGAVRAVDALDTPGEATEGLELRWAAVGGGMADILRLAVVLGAARLGRGLTPATPGGFLPAGGVFVLDVDALDTPLLPSCFVGDFVGDRMPFNPDLAPGVGLLAIALALLPGASTRLCLLSPLTGPGRLAFAGAPLLAAACALGFASSSTCRTPAGRRNMP